MSTTETPIPEPPYPQDPTPPVTLVLTILLLVMFFVGFFSIYFCRCFLENIVNSLNNRQTPNGTPINPTSLTPPGLDSAIVNYFPTFTYSTVKDYRRERYGLECAICLCEFDDDDTLRLLTICCHVFHQECIDLWFKSQTSCPVCRRNLQDVDITQSSDKFLTVETTRNSVGNNNNTADTDDVVVVHGSNSMDNDDITIVVKEEDNYDEEPINELSKGDMNDSSVSEKFSRSHSTGHSIFRNSVKEDEDKYTLRIPEHVKDSITRKHHIVTLSCTTFGEYSSSSTRKHEGFGEISGCSMQQDLNKV